jgi:D-alanyl-D-alanine carboxypeptidase
VAKGALGLLVVIAVIVAVSGAQTAGAAASSSTATGAAGTGAPTGAAAASGAPLPPKQRARLRAAVRTALRIAASPGAVVGVQSPRGRWVRAFGIANVRSRARMRTDVHQRIGSVTKTFTGALLMQLVGEGKLSLDDTIDKYVGGVPNGATITLRQLADMTSGVASYSENSAFTEAFLAHPRRRWTPREVLDLGLAVSPKFPPGTAFDYSNTNFILLGMVIRQVARKPIGALLRERIIAPLKLNGTVWPAGSAALPAPHAQGYTLQGQSSDKPVDATDWTTSAEWTAGELISTVDDLLVYGRATATGKGLLPRKPQRERLDSFNPRIPPESATDIPATSRASQPPSTTTVTSARPSSSRPTAISTAAPAKGRRRWSQTRSRGHVRARRIGSWEPSPGALGAPTSFRQDDGYRPPAKSSPGTVRHGDARVAACLGAAIATSSPRRLQPGSGSRRAGGICRWPTSRSRPSRTRIATGRRSPSRRARRSPLCPRRWL